MDKFDEILAGVAKPVNGSCWILTYDKLDQLEGPDIGVSFKFLVRVISTKLICLKLSCIQKQNQLQRP